MECSALIAVYIFFTGTQRERMSPKVHTSNTKYCIKASSTRCFSKDCRTGREKDNFISQGELEILPFDRQPHSCCHFHSSYIQQSSTLIPMHTWAKDPLTLEFSAKHAFSSSIFVIWRQSSFSSILKTNCIFHISRMSDTYFITYM